MLKNYKARPKIVAKPRPLAPEPAVAAQRALVATMATVKSFTPNSVQEYGVKGMKWGVRKDNKPSRSRRASVAGTYDRSGNVTHDPFGGLTSKAKAARRKQAALRSVPKKDRWMYQ